MQGANPTWSLLSSHGAVLFVLAANPDSTVREIAERVRVTERTVFSVIQDLAAAHMVCSRKVGRRNSYAVNREAHLVHPNFSHLQVGPFIDAMLNPPARMAR
jgi:winged helix-turn-helix DNA-binding protein